MNNKIPILLKQAERESNSPAAEKSSVTSATRRFSTAPEAEANFRRLREKLFQIDKWSDKSAFGYFELFDSNGNISSGKAAVEDFIKITLPGSGKSDWVRIIEIYDVPDEVVLTVQPSYDPTEETPEKDVTSHFFTDDSTNNFCLERENNTLQLYVIGLSEKSNTAETKNIIESARNFATANLGRYLGIQKNEWQIFCDNFLETETSEKSEK